MVKFRVRMPATIDLAGFLSDDENRPGILVDNSSLIYVIYTAEANQPVPLFYSVSSDNGGHFSAAKPVSDKAGKRIHFRASWEWIRSEGFMRFGMMSVLAPTGNSREIPFIPQGLGRVPGCFLRTKKPNENLMVKKTVWQIQP